MCIRDRAYTLVLKCHIAAARAVFKAGSAGMHIDILARETLWRRGLDYRCGTGHGVGFVGVIHEGPQGVPFPVSWTVKMKKKQKETQDILSDVYKRQVYPSRSIAPSIFSSRPSPLPGGTTLPSLYRASLMCT